jgi:hypothetical protein
MKGSTRTRECKPRFMHDNCNYFPEVDTDVPEVPNTMAT